MELLVHELNAEGQDDSAHDSDDNGTEDAYLRDSRTDSDQGTERTVQGKRRVRLLVACPGKEEGDDSSRGTGEGRRYSRIQRDSVKSKLASGVEPVPARPQDESAEHRHGNVVAGNGLRLSVDVLADSWTDKESSCQRGESTHGMDGTASREVKEAKLGKPAPAPDPVAYHRIDDAGHQCADHEVSAELEPLRNRSAYYRGGGGAEHRLEQQINVRA